VKTRRASASPRVPLDAVGVASLGVKLLVTYLENVKSRVRVFETDGTFVREVELPGAGTVMGFTQAWMTNSFRRRGPER
jgi:prolyl oligopeptidase PreP (S9A serine peptidase family)